MIESYYEWITQSTVVLPFCVRVSDIQKAVHRGTPEQIAWLGWHQHMDRYAEFIDSRFNKRE